MCPEEPEYFTIDGRTYIRVEEEVPDEIFQWYLKTRWVDDGKGWFKPAPGSDPYPGDECDP